MLKFLEFLVNTVKDWVSGTDVDENVDEQSFSLNLLQNPDQPSLENSPLDQGKESLEPVFPRLDQGGSGGVNSSKSRVHNPTSPPTGNEEIKQNNLTIQEQINGLENEGTLQLFPPGGEYRGPIVINRPLTLDGQGATIWSRKGSVVLIRSPGVNLRNIRIEVTGENSQKGCAILVQSGGESLICSNVEVRGQIMGISAEEGEWRYPTVLNLGQLDHNTKPLVMLLRVIVPVPCKIAADISGLSFQPRDLTRGANEIKISLDLQSLPEDTLLNGGIFLFSDKVKRRINFNAHILSKNAPSVERPELIFEPDDWDDYIKPSLKSEPVSNPNDSRSLTQPSEPSQPEQISEKITVSLPSSVFGTKSNHKSKETNQQNYQINSLDQSVFGTKSNHKSKGETQKSSSIPHLDGSVFGTQYNHKSQGENQQNYQIYSEDELIFGTQSNEKTNPKPQQKFKKNQSSLPTNIFDSDI